MSQNNLIAKVLALPLNDKEAKTLLALIRDGRIKDSKLKEILGFKSENSAAYYRRRLEEAGIIERYAAVVNWQRLGYGTKFMIIVEGKDEKMFHEIERDHLFSADEYLNKIGEIVVTPTIFGPVILKEVSTSYGVVGIITGYAVSEDAARNYSEVYLKERYPGIKTTTYILKDATIKDFFIQKDFIEKYKALFPPTEKDIKRLERFKEKFFRLFSSGKSE